MFKKKEKKLTKKEWKEKQRREEQELLDEAEWIDWKKLLPLGTSCTVCGVKGVVMVRGRLLQRPTLNDSGALLFYATERSWVTEVFFPSTGHTESFSRIQEGCIKWKQ